MEILLNKNIGKRSANSASNIRTKLSGNNKKLPLDKIIENISAERQYQEERSGCTNIRLTTTINPICSNVLNNKITEIIYKEGDKKCRCLNMGESQNGWPTSNLLFKKTFQNLNQDASEDDTIYQAIRDTQLTQDKECVYHCGLDIFNNHILRSKTFKTICLPKSTKQNLPDFNTIDDMMRTIDSKQIVGYKNDGTTSKLGIPNINLHLYTADDILSFEESIAENYIEENGWFGFKNASKMRVYSGVTKELDTDKINVCNINSVINNRISCDFIHMAPEKDLFSFTPKYNQYQNRIEKNWHYRITYPSSATTEVPYIRTKTNSLKAIYFNDKYHNSNGTNGLKIYSVTKHGLNIGDTVNIYNGNDVILNNSNVVLVEDEYSFVCELGTKILSDYTVNINTPIWRKVYSDEITSDISLLPFDLDDICLKYGDNDDILFTKKSDERHINLIKQGWTLLVEEKTVINYNGIDYELKDTEQKVTINGRIVVIPPKLPNKKYYIQPDGTVNMDDNMSDISFKQVVNGEEVEYYVRIFSVLPNWKFATEKPTEFNIYKPNSTMIEDNQRYGFNNEISELGFAKNIYGDSISQIVFTENIDINSLRDNLGRPLTDIYLTILKNNKGYKEWYDSSNWTDGELDTEADIEFSHMFGKLNCGFNLSPNALILPNKECLGHIIGMNNLFDEPYYIGGNDLTEEPNFIGLSGLTNLNDSTTDEINIDEDVHFYGDLCCLSRVAYAEKTIDDAMFRFNTSQRELGSLYNNDVYNHISYDEITGDDYDYQTSTASAQRSRSNNNENTGKLTTKYTIPSTMDGVPSEWRDFNPCARPEGYCYKAHYKIPIKTYSQELESQYPKTIYIQQTPDIVEINEEKGLVYGSIKTSKNNYFEQYDVFVLYDDIDDVYYHGEVLNITNLQEFDFCLHTNKNPFKNRNFNTFRLLRKDSTIPSYALLTKDGTCRYVWRWLLQNGEDKYRTNEVYPFTNGAFYVNQHINFYLKRQDPDKYMDTFRYLDFDDEPFNIEANKTTKQNDNTYKSEGEMTC